MYALLLTLYVCLVFVCGALIWILQRMMCSCLQKQAEEEAPLAEKTEEQMADEEQKEDKEEENEEMEVL